jgi:hypothetical protein
MPYLQEWAQIPWKAGCRSPMHHPPSPLGVIQTTPALAACCAALRQAERDGLYTGYVRLQELISTPAGVLGFLPKPWCGSSIAAHRHGAYLRASP